MPSRSGANCTLIGKSVPIALTDYYTNLIEVQNVAPEYLHFLEAYGVSPIEAHGTITGWRKFVCEGKHEYYYPEANTGEFNPFALWGSVRRAASRSMRKIESLKELRNVYDITLTYPNEVSMLAIEQNSDIEHKCHECFKDFVKRLSMVVYRYQDPGRGKKTLKACQLAISENFHIWKSEEPIKPHLHHHFLMLDVYLGKNKKKGRIFSHRFLEYDKMSKSWREGKLTKQIKTIWAYCVNRHFNTNYETLDVHNYVISVDRDRARLVHKLKYKKRLPLCDLAEYYRNNDFKPEGMHSQFIYHLLTYRNKTHSFGYWNRLLCTIDNFEMRKAEYHCPFCGKKAADLGIKPLPDNARRVHIDRKGRLWELLTSGGGT